MELRESVETPDKGADVKANMESQKNVETLDENVDTKTNNIVGDAGEVAVVSIDTTDKRVQSNISRQSNSFAAKKTVAQGMMDVALITANANQLRYLIEYQRDSRTFYITLSLIIVSLILQIAVGISLIFKGRFDIKGKSKSINAERINNYVVVAVFLITIINVFIAAFSGSPSIAPLENNP